MRLVVFSGFLGSGKTTLIIALAKHLAQAGHTMCFIVNEVGEIGIDQAVMRDDDLRVWEITAGCICCQLGLDLVKTLQKVATEYDPELVIVEASGVASPSGIIDALRGYSGPRLDDRCLVTVVDPTRLRLLWEVMTPLVEAQIGQADEIVITKLALSSSEEIAFAERTVEEVNKTARTWKVDAHDSSSLDPLLTYFTATVS